MQESVGRALAYHKRGLAPIFIPYMSKDPNRKGWTNERLTEEEVRAAFERQSNIGILLGPASNGLVDIDLDTPLAIALAPRYLPETHARFGRPSKRNSHWLYRVGDEALRTEKNVHPEPPHRMIVEIRYDGAQTVFPGSVHESGEKIEWESAGENEVPDAASVEAEHLKKCVHKLWAACVLAGVWSDGSRHEAAMALGGVFARAGWPAQEAIEFCVPWMQAAGDAEVMDRVRAIEDTYEAWEESEDAEITGWPRLKEIFGERVTTALQRRLDLRSFANLPRYTDLGNAERLILAHGRDLKYNVTAKVWYYWTGTHWKKDHKGGGEAQRRAQMVVQDMRARAEQMPDGDAKTALDKWAKQSESEARLRAMVNLAKALEGVEVDYSFFDRDPYLINCLNCTINIATRTPQPHDRDDYITQITPVAFRQEVTSELWERTLRHTFAGDEELEGFVRRAMGYSAIGYNPEELLFFAFGPTGTGKSTFLEACKAALGSDYAATANFESFLQNKNRSGPRDDIAALNGKRLITSVEVDKGRRLAEGLIKGMTGGDTMRVRFLYEGEFEFKPGFKLWLAANDNPLVSDDDDAIWRRIIRIPFTQQVDSRDPSVKARLTDPKESGEAILAWIIRGAFEWREHGLEVPQTVLDFTKAYREEVNPLIEFVEDRCERGSEYTAPSGELWDAYTEWTTDSGYKGRGITRKRFGQHLASLGFEQDREKGGVRCWRGLRLREVIRGDIDNGDVEIDFDQFL